MPLNYMPRKLHIYLVLCETALFNTSLLSHNIHHQHCILHVYCPAKEHARLVSRVTIYRQTGMALTLASADECSWC